MKNKELHVPPGASTEVIGSVRAALQLPSDLSDLLVAQEAARLEAFQADCPARFAQLYLRSECLSKFDDRDPSRAAERKRVAIEAFFASEVTCGNSNKRLAEVLSRPNLSTTLWSRARGLDGSLLGQFDYEEFISSCGFGPGASSGLRRSASSHQNKWELSSHITVGALPYHLAFVRWTELPVPASLVVVSGNRVTTVAKNSKTDRVIAIEPDWNMFFQKGIGKMIRRRLRRRGLLTRDAQDVNRLRSRLGSSTGELATLDLKAASDTISLAVVEALLPPDWLEHILRLRSETGEVDGATILYEKVSSMGNGFTFELETLCFWALASAVCGKGDQVNVYGDDLIVPTIRAAAVVRFLTEAGFSVNDSKSFSSGPFRESCGGHYWSGCDVSPFLSLIHI